MDTILESEAMQKLVKRVEEAARSTKEGVRYFVEPAQGTLSRAISKRHHMVFGRRGSGKSSLLRKAQVELALERRPISYVDLEAFKGHAYPDVLLSILISTFEGFRDWLRGAAVNPANKTTFWKRWFERSPEKPAYNKKSCQAIRERIEEMLVELRWQLHSADDAAMELHSAQEQGGTISSAAKAQVALGRLSAGVKTSLHSNERVSAEAIENFRRSKIDFLHRHIIDYQGVFRQMGDVSSGDAYLFLDDLYHILPGAVFIEHFHIAA